MNDGKLQNDEHNITDEHQPSYPPTPLTTQPDREGESQRRAPHDAQFCNLDRTSIELAFSLNHDDTHAKCQQENVAADGVGY